MTRWWTLALVAGLAACAEKDPEDGEDGGSTADEGYGSSCEELSRTEVTDGSVAADGFSFAAGPVLEAHAGSFDGVAQDPFSGDRFDVRATFRLDGAVFAVDQEPTPSTDGAESDLMWAECPDFYETQVGLGLAIGDGLVLVEDATATLQLWAEDDGTTHLELAEGAFSADLVPAEVVLEEWDSWAMDLYVELVADGWTGSVDFFAERSDAEVAEAMGVEVLGFALGGAVEGME